MPRLSSRASWKSFRQQDCQEFNGCRAGTMPTQLAGARSLSMPPRSRRAAHVLHSLRDGSRCSTREFPDRRAPTTPKRSSVRRKVKRWDGIQRTTTVWDSLRRDPELWFPSGDCLVHFYKPGQSRRGPSLRVSLAYVQSNDFSSFLDQYPPQPVLMNPSSSRGPPRRDSLLDVAYEVYVPAPSHLSTEDALRYHLTTRNIFAWMYDLPVVGESLGGALIALLERLNLFRPDQAQNEDDLLAYLASQDYVDFRDCPNHSLALLNFAEAGQNRELWTDAFVHSVGMYDDLTLSGEFEFVSRPSKALMLRAHLEMDLRLEHAGSSLGAFLEDDLSSAYLGLGREARAHLERFRCFLHAFYVGKHGYWPPAPLQRNSTALPKSICQTMYLDFRNLYEYLVDPGSSGSIQDNRPADGGICVLQNIKNFDTRNKYASLPHPLPLVPELRTMPKPHKPSGITIIFGKRQTKLDRRAIALTALSAATNSSSVVVMGCPLVREYLRFEETWTMKESETISCSDARKVRWILIYSILQTLISVTGAPREVKDTEGVSYPLCCQTAGTPPWQNVAKERHVEAIGGQMTANVSRQASTIEPDIDYRTPSRTSSIITADIPPPISVPRKVSVGSDLTLRTPIPRKLTSCDILTPGYGEPARSARAMSDPSTVASSADGTTSGGGWSSTSSEDDMDHVSIMGSGSEKGLHEGEVDVFQEGMDDLRELRALAKRISRTNFRSVTWGPKVDQTPIP